MGITDDVAARMLSAQVGALRVGSRVFGLSIQDLEDVEDVIASRLRRGRPVVQVIKSAASRIGDSIEEQVNAFAESRIQQLLRTIRESSGLSLKEPKDIGSLRVMKGSVSKFMEDATDNAVSRARFAQETGVEDADAVTRALRAHAKTIAKSGINAAHNAAVISIARANKTAVKGVLALATLDNRTTEICRDRHGGAWDVTSGDPLAFSTTQEDFPGRPPWHFNCRTTLTPVFEGAPDPTEETMDREEWFKTEEAAQAFGDSQIALFNEGTITKSQLVDVGPDEPVPDKLLLAEQFDEVFAHQKLANSGQERAMDSYAHSGYGAINRALRVTGTTQNNVFGENLMTPEIESKIKFIDTAINENSISKPVKVFRGFGRGAQVKLANIDALKKGGELEVGDVMQDAAFSSTSLEEKISKSFGGTGGVLLEMTLPEGTRAFRVRSRGHASDEAEVLLPRNAQFKVVGVTEEPDTRSWSKKNSTIRRISVEYVPPPTSQPLPVYTKESLSDPAVKAKAEKEFGFKPSTPVKEIEDKLNPDMVTGVTLAGLKTTTSQPIPLPQQTIPQQSKPYADQSSQIKATQSALKTSLDEGQKAQFKELLDKGADPVPIKQSTFWVVPSHKIKKDGDILVHDSVGDPDITKKVKDAYAELPSELRAKMKEMNFPLIASGKISEMKNSLVLKKNVSPEDEKFVAGYYGAKRGTVVINTAAETNQSKKSLTMTMAHEIGHVVDLSKEGKPLSDSELFKLAVALDMKENAQVIKTLKTTLTQTEAHRLEYAMGSRKETFAELFSHALGIKGGHPLPNLLNAQRAVFPRSIQAINKLYEQWKTTKVSAPMPKGSNYTTYRPGAKPDED